MSMCLDCGNMTSFPSDSCPFCGCANTQPKTQVSPQPSEEIMCVVPNLKKAISLSRSNLYALVVTNRRSILARTTNEMLQKASEKAQEEARMKKENLTHRWTAQIKAVANYAEKYWHMQPEEIVNETSDNIVIENQDISTIRIFRKRFRGMPDYWQIQINSDSGALVFQTDYDPEKSLTHAHGNKVNASR